MTSRRSQENGQKPRPGCRSRKSADTQQIAHSLTERWGTDRPPREPLVQSRGEGTSRNKGKGCRSGADLRDWSNPQMDLDDEDLDGGAQVTLVTLDQLEAKPSMICQEEGAWTWSLYGRVVAYFRRTGVPRLLIKQQLSPLPGRLN